MVVRTRYSAQRPREGAIPIGAKKQSVRITLLRGVSHLLLLVGLACVLIPFYWMIITSFKEPLEALIFPPEWWPRSWHPENYPNAMKMMSFPVNLRNTCIITSSAIVGTLLSSSLAGFAFGRLRWPGRNLWFGVVLATMMLPGQVTLIPQFILFKELRWIDTFYPLIVPAYFGGGAFNVFLTRQFVLTLPRELDDAARIDGASTFRIWWQMVLPLTKPVLATIGMFTFIYRWHQFMGPLIYLNSPGKWTLELGLRMLASTRPELPIPMMAYHMAMATLAMAPPLLVFYLGQRYFVAGIVMTGTKG